MISTVNIFWWLQVIFKSKVHSSVCLGWRLNYNLRKNVRVVTVQLIEKRHTNRVSKNKRILKIKINLNNLKTYSIFLRMVCAASIIVFFLLVCSFFFTNILETLNNALKNTEKNKNQHHRKNMKFTNTAQEEFFFIFLFFPLSYVFNTETKTKTKKKHEAQIFFFH